MRISGAPDMSAPRGKVGLEPKRRPRRTHPRGGYQTGRRARRQEKWQLPAQRQDKGSDRGLEAHKITALTSAWGSGQGPQIIIEPHFASRKSLM